MRAVLFLASSLPGIAFASGPIERTEFTKYEIAHRPEGLPALGEVVLSRSGSQIAYIASDGTRMYPVVGESVGATGDFVFAPALGKAHSAHLTVSGGTMDEAGSLRGGVAHLFVDAKERRKSTAGAAGISEVTFLADTDELAYSYFADGKYRFVIGDRETPKLFGVGPAAVSLAGNRVAYGAELEEGKWRIAVGLDLGTSSWAVTTDPVLSLRGDAMAYFTGDRPDAVFLQVEELPSRKVVHRGERAWATALKPVFSDDGKHFALAVSDGAKWQMVRDGSVLPGTHDVISRVAISPSGTRVAWVAKDGDATKLLLDGKVIAKLPAAATALLVDDKHYAYALEDAAGLRIVHDGRPVPMTGKVDRLSIALGNDGTLAFTTRQVREEGGLLWLQVGSHRYGPYEWVMGPWFSPDDKRVTWVSSEGTGFWWRVAPVGAADDAELRRSAAVQKARKQDFAGSIAELDVGLALTPGDPELLDLRARAKSALGKVPEALADLDLALARDKTDFGALTTRYLLRLGTGDLTGAEVDAQALASYSGLANGWVFLAELQRDSDTKRALQNADRAVTLAPWWSYALTTRASIRSRTGDARGAIADTELAMKLDPADPNAWYIRAGVHFSRKKKDLGCADLKTAADMGHVDSRRLFDEGCASR
jgi:hypothetical protein